MTILAPPTTTQRQFRAERLWARVQINNADECWPWSGHRNEFGYGHLRVNGRTQKAHRVAYALTNGDIRSDQVVMHRCDNPPCCNPAHLRLGTVSENNADRHAKGRSSIPVHPPKDRCGRGHRFTAENTYIRPRRGDRDCRTCIRIRQAKSRARTT